MTASSAATAYQASHQLAADLQSVLVDLVNLHLQAKQAHWNVVGRDFRSLHLQLDEITDLAREASDTIAERLRALSAVADGRVATVAATSTLPPFPAGEHDTQEVAARFTEQIRAAVATMRRVHDAVDAEDPSSSDLLHGIIVGLEKHAWMLSAETRLSP
jgi:starvation-inducible DNA-binding protein